MVFQNPFASLNPRKKIGQALEEPLAINTALVGRRPRRAGPGDARPGRPAARAPRALSAHVLRRAAAARRHRPRADARAEGRGRRRAGLGARRLDPGAGAQPPDGPAGRDRRRLRLHLAQPRGGRADRRRSAGDVSRPGHGARPQGRALRRAAPSLHPRPAGQHAPGRRRSRRSGAGPRRTHRALRRAAVAAGAALGLRLSHPLPARDRAPAPKSSRRWFRSARGTKRPASVSTRSETLDQESEGRPRPTATPVSALEPAPATANRASP